MKKKLLSLLLCFALMTALSVSAFAAVYPETEEKPNGVKEGDIVSVVVKNDVEFSGVTSFEFYIFYDTEKFAFVDSKKGNVKALCSDPDETELVINCSNPVERVDQLDNTKKKCMSISVVDTTTTGMKIPVGTLRTVNFKALRDIPNTEEHGFYFERGFVEDLSFKDTDMGPLKGSGVSMDVGLWTVQTPTDVIEVKPEVKVEGDTAKAEVSEDVEVEEDKPFAISATSEATAAKTEVSIPAAVMEQMASASSLTLENNDFAMEFDKSALGQMAGAQNVKISMASEKQENGDVKFELTAMAGDRNVFNGNGGSVTVKYPCAAPEEGKQINVYWKDGENLIRVPARYEAPNLVFTLSHFTEIVAKTQDKDKGYTITAPEDISVVKGDEIAVSFTVDNTDENVTAYNAFQLVLNYDPDMLTYSQVRLGETAVAQDSNTVQISDMNGVLTIKGCGEDRTAPITVVFTDKAIGSSSVKVTEAKIDKAANAPTQNTPVAAIPDAECMVKVNGYTVSLDSDFTGEDVAKPGEAYTFTAKDKNYTYDVTVTVGGTPIEGVVDNGDGSFTIPADKITGAIEVVTESRTPKAFDVTLDGELVDGDVKATYLTNYTFTLKDVAGYTVSLDGITIGGTAYTDYTLTDGTYTIPGADITGDIAISAKKELIPVTETTVTFEGVEAGEVVGGLTQQAELGKDFPFEINKDEAYDYTVMLGDEELLPREDGKYVIPAAKLTGPVKLTIIKTPKSGLTVKVDEYLKLGSSEESKTMWLVTATGALGEGKVYAYDENAMFWSEKYSAYAWLVITEGSKTLSVDAAKALVSEATAAKTVVAYNFDVNMTSGVVDTNDAQLVYNMYNFYYNDFAAVSMEKFLRADLNGDKTINVSDAAAVVDHIMGK